MKTIKRITIVLAAILFAAGIIAFSVFIPLRNALYTAQAYAEAAEQAEAEQEPEYEEPEYVQEPEPIEAEPIAYEYERCACGGGYAHEAGRTPTPPINIEESPAEGFLDQFNTVHSFTHQEWDTDWYATLVFWADEPIKYFSFIALGHVFLPWQQYTYEYEKLFTIDELLPDDAFKLNVAFAHYLIPRGGLAFTDANGERRHMVISESMRGGCFPHFHIGYFVDRTLRDATLNSIEPTPAQEEMLLRLFGDFQLGEVQTQYFFDNWHGNYESIQFRFLYHESQPPFSLENADDWRATAYPLTAAAENLMQQTCVGVTIFFDSNYFTTSEGDVIFVHSPRFDDAWLFIDMGERVTDWGTERDYIVIILDCCPDTFRFICI